MADYTRIGGFRHRITLQSLSRTRDSFGEPVEVWVDEATVWGAIRPYSGKEQEVGRALRGSTTHEVRIRYPGPEGLDCTWRIKYGDRIFNIKSIINVNECNKELVIVADEIVGG